MEEEYVIISSYSGLLIFLRIYLGKIMFIYNFAFGIEQIHLFENSDKSFLICITDIGEFIYFPLENNKNTVNFYFSFFILFVINGIK